MKITDIPFHSSTILTDINKMLANFDAILHFPDRRIPLPKVFYTSMSDKTVANTSTETSLLDITSNLGYYNLDGDWFEIGTIMKVHVDGLLSTGGGWGGTLQFRFKIGSTTVFDSTAISPGAGRSNSLLQMDGLILCRSSGASGVLTANTFLLRADGTGSPATPKMINASNVTLDTTVAHTLDITGQWSAGASAAETLTIKLVNLEKIR